MANQNTNFAVNSHNPNIWDFCYISLAYDKYPICRNVPVCIAYGTAAMFPYVYHMGLF